MASLRMGGGPRVAAPGQAATTTDDAPVVTKVEPPNWWLKLTPELMVLVSGQHLEATGVSCNLPNLVVERTQATAGGSYLFVWLKLEPEIKSGTAGCRITTTAGATTFQLPVAGGSQNNHKFSRITPEDVMYLIMPDRF